MSLTIALAPFLHYSEGVWSGLMYGLIDAVVREMGMTHTLIPDRYVLLDPGATSPLLLGANSTIDFSAVRTTNEKAWHHDQAASVVRTTSIFNSYYSGVQYRTSSDSGMFGLFQPFSDSLWLALFITMACAGLVMAFLADLSAGSGRRLQLRSDGTIAGAIKDLRSATHTQWPDVASSGASGATWLLMQIWHYVLAIPEGFYQSFSAMVGGVEYGASDWASKVLRLGLLIFALVVSATYTANLASIFTEPAYKIRGPMTLSGLSTAKACVATRSAEAIASSLVGRGVIRPPASIPRGAGTREWCLAALQDARADIFIVEVNSARDHHLKRCNVTYLSTWLAAGTISVAFQARTADAELAHNISLAFLHTMATSEYIAQQSRTFRMEETCKDAAARHQVDFHSMAGLFFIFGGFATFALLLEMAARQRAEPYQKAAGIGGAGKEHDQEMPREGGTCERNEVQSTCAAGSAMVSREELKQMIDARLGQSSEAMKQLVDEGVRKVVAAFSATVVAGCTPQGPLGHAQDGRGHGHGHGHFSGQWR